MADKPVNHGWDHRPGGTDPIPGLNFLPLAVCECVPSTKLTVTAGHTSAISWTDVEITDSSTFSWSSSTPTKLNLLVTGVYMAWLMIAGDSDWPASGDGFIRWYANAPGGVLCPTVLVPLGGHPNIDTFSDAASTSPTESVGSLTSLFIDGTGFYMTGDVANSSTGDFTVASPAYMIVYRLGDSVTLA